MKKILFVLLLLVTIGLAGCNTVEEKRAERAINAYYDALIDNEFEVAFNKLFMYDEDSTHPTALSKLETKEVYLDKIKYLQQHDYKLVAYNIRDVEYEDGHSFWHHLDIEVVQGEDTFHWEEIVFYRDGKLIISGDDPYINYRDGKMIVETEE